MTCEDRPIPTIAPQQKSSIVSAPATDREMLDKVYHDLVGVHVSMSEATSKDLGALPWARDELMEVIRELGAFRKTTKRDT